MQMGMVGLGKMGSNMTRRLMRGGHQLFVSDLSADTVKQLGKEGATESNSLDDLTCRNHPPQAVRHLRVDQMWHMQLRLTESSARGSGVQ